MVWCDDAAVGMLVPSGPAGGSWVLTNADQVVALVVVWGCCFGGPCNGVTLGFRPTTTAVQGVSICAVGWSLFLVVLACLLGLPTSWREEPSWWCESEVGQHRGGW